MIYVIMKNYLRVLIDALEELMIKLNINFQKICIVFIKLKMLILFLLILHI